MEKTDAVGEVIDFSLQNPLGSCPKCGGFVFEHENFYVCEKSVVTDEGVEASCDFRLGQTLLEKLISHKQLGKLLDFGKTDIIKGFVSMRTRKTFSAQLCWSVEEDRVRWDIPVAPKRIKKAKVIEPVTLNLLNTIHKAEWTFASTHQSASEIFLEDLLKLGNSFSEKDEFRTIYSKIGNKLQTVEQSIFLKFLERKDCPDWLGVWTAKHGRKEQQFAYLFQPSVTNKISISDRINCRSPEISKLFLRSKSAVIVSNLLNYDDESYLVWARDLGFDGEIKVPNLEPENEDDYIPTLREQVEVWLANVLDPILDALWKEYVPDKGACNVLQGEMVRWIRKLENEYWRNGMGNMGGADSYGYFEGIVDKIKTTALSRDTFSNLVKRVVVVDSSIVKHPNHEKLSELSLMQVSNVEEALTRLSRVVAAWCLRNKEPIPYSE